MYYHFFTDIVEFFKPYEALHENSIILINSFLKKCVKKTYTPEFTRQIISQTKYIIKCCPHNIEDTQFESVMTELTNFLCYPSMSIRLEVVRTFSYIFNQDWVSRGINLSAFYSDIFSKAVFDHQNLVSFINIVLKS